MKMSKEKSVIAIRILKLKLCTIIGASFCLMGMSSVNADHRASSIGEKKYHEGKEIFSKYCARCHGKNADGRGPVAPLFIKLKTPRPSNFTIKFYSIRPVEYLAAIVRDGGEAHSLSKSMPPFGEELSPNQISDVIYYIKNISIHANRQKLNTSSR